MIINFPAVPWGSLCPFFLPSFTAVSQLHAKSSIVKSSFLESTCKMGSGFPDASVDKEATCNAGDPGSIPGLGRSAGEGTGYPFQYSWASLVAQLVKNPPAMRETWV